MVNFQSDVSVFPPTKGKTPILKFARHGHGYVTEVRDGEEDEAANQVAKEGATLPVGSRRLRAASQAFQS
jgi:hypothetical protein